MTIILAMGGVGFAISSVIKGDIANATPLITSSSGVFSVVLAVPAMFVGFDVIPQTAEEMNLPMKKIPKAIIFSICLAAAWYILVILSVAFSAPRSILSEGGLTVVNAINYSTGEVLAGKLIIVTAVMGILSSWNGFIIGATRVLYSMGRAKMLPSIFGTLHNQYKTPYFATLFIGLITVLTPLLGQNSLGWFVDASSFGTVVAYFMVALSFIILRKKEPKTKRPFKIKNGIVVGVIAVMIALFFITLYLPIGASSLTSIEWIIVLVWCLIGFAFYLSNLKNVKSNKEDREKVMYGKE